MTAEPVHRPNATAASLLGFLYWQPLSGGDLTTFVEASVAYFWNVTRSQIYRELRTLAANGLITSDETGPRGRRTHTITDAGRAAFMEWLATPPGPDLVRSPFLARFFFGILLDEGRVREFVEDYRRIQQERIKYFRDLIPEISHSDPVPAHVARLGLALAEATLQWLDNVPWEVWERKDSHARYRE